MSRGPGRVQRRVLDAIEEYRHAELLIWRGGDVIGGFMTVYLDGSVLCPDEGLIDARGVARWIADHGDISPQSFSRALHKLVERGALKHVRGFDPSQRRFFRRSK